MSMTLVRFVHAFGMCLWIGGAIATMVIALGVQKEAAEVRAGVYRVLARIQTSVVGLGALLVVASGFLLMMDYSTSGLEVMMREPSRWVMVLVGLLAGVIVLFVALPTAVRMGGLSVVSDGGEMPPAFEIYRRRLEVISYVAGLLAVFALFAWFAL
jgi:hypothetical protein